MATVVHVAHSSPSLLDSQEHPWARHERVIVFDGLCNWCNAFVTFTINRDPTRMFKFGTLQSADGQKILHELNLPTDDFTTFLLIEKGKVSTKSTAGLKVARQLSGLWPILYVFIVIPRPIRDVLYDWIARHRYRWMGRAESCRIPSPHEQERFI